MSNVNMIYSTMVPNIVQLNTLNFHKDRTISCKFINSRKQIF